MLYYDVSLYILVLLVILISTSPRTSKTESGCKSYDRFCFGYSAVFPSSGSTGAGTAGNPFGMPVESASLILIVLVIDDNSISALIPVLESFQVKYIQITALAHLEREEEEAQNWSLPF